MSRKPEGSEVVIFEIPAWRIRPSRFIPFFFLVVALFVALFIAVPSYTMILPALLAIYLMYSITFSLNPRSGIYSNGIRPLRKSLIPFPCVPWPVFVNYEEIASIDFNGDLKRFPGKTPFQFTIRTKRGKRYITHAEDLLTTLGFRDEILEFGRIFNELGRRFAEGQSDFSDLKVEFDARVASDADRNAGVRRDFLAIEAGQWLAFGGIIFGILWAGFGQAGLFDLMLFACLILAVLGVLLMAIGGASYARHLSSKRRR